MDKLKITILSTTKQRITDNTGFAREGRAFRCPWLGQKIIKCIFSRSSIPQYLTTIRVFLCCLSISRLPLICLRIGGRTKIKTQRCQTCPGEHPNLVQQVNLAAARVASSRRKIIFADRGPQIKLPRRFSDSSLRFVTTYFVLRVQ